MRDFLQLLAAAAAVLLVGFGAYQLLFGSPVSTSLVIQQSSGGVEVEARGERAAARVGGRLGEADLIVTREDGRAVLSIATGEEVGELILERGSSLKVLGEDEDGLRVELQAGRVEATVQPGGRGVGVLAAGREVRARDADFAVVVREGGEGARDVAAEVRRGRVALEGFGERLELEAGERVLAPAGEPVTALRVPEALLLQVAWPDKLRVREEALTIEGRTEPGARVFIEAGGERVEAEVEGDRFTAVVPLVDGENEVVIEADGVLGDAARERREVVRDGQGPTADFEVRF